MKKDRMWAVYGNVTIPRAKCWKCKQTSLVIDERTVCCDVLIEISSISQTKRMIESNFDRKKPSKRDQNEILLRQNNQCFYCNLLFGSVVKINKKPIILRIHWDHSMPYSYSQNNRGYNFVASCHICNMIKHNKIFSTVEEAREYIAHRKQEKRYNF